MINLVLGKNPPVYRKEENGFMRIYKNTFSFVIILSVLLFMATGCKKQGYVWQKLELADSLIEDRPDSSFVILKGISANDLNGKEEKARYALLMSMALDKNYIDTTTFDVLQPAIDYYLKKGNPDEKLRTYYYQGVIYQNRGEKEKAISSFFMGRNLAPEIKDSMVLARTLAAQALLYRYFRDFKSYTKYYELSTELFRKLGKEKLMFDGLLNTLNGYITLKNKEKADSVENLILDIESLDEHDYKDLQEFRLTKAIQFETSDEIRKMLREIDIKGLNINGFISLALAYNKLGETDKAIDMLNKIIKSGLSFDTIRYEAVKIIVLRDSEKYREALNAYWDLNHRLDSLNTIKYDQKSRDIEEKYKLELLAQQEVNKRKNAESVLIFGIIIFVFAILILLLFIRNHKTQKKLAQQRAKISESENSRLKTEKEKLLLEAENMSHRISALEEESETLKNIIKTHDELPKEVQKAIKFRIEMLNGLLAGYITNNDQYEKPYEEWIREIKENTEEFMNSNRLAFQASHPRFIKYFEDRGLTVPEINYVCLYALGLKGKEISEYIQLKRLYHVSSDIRKKLGMEEHETNIGLFIRKLLKSL